MDQFIGQLRQKMQEFRIGVLRVEDVDEANGKIILTVSQADAAMYQQKKMHQGSTADSDNKNLSRFPVDFTGTSGEVFLLFLSGKPMLLCQRNRSDIPLRQPPMRPWTTKLTLTSRNCCLLHYWPNRCHHRQVHARVNLFHN